MTKRRRGTQTQRQRTARPGWERTQPVTADGVSTSIPGLPWLVGGAIVLVVLAVGFILLRPGGGRRAARRARAPRRRTASTARRASRRPLPAGETRTVTLDTDKGAIVIKVEADLSPIAAGNFVALAVVRVLRRHGLPPASCPKLRHPGRRPDRDRHRRPGLHDPGRAGDAPTSAATVAMARTPQPNSVGSQFFIVLDDKAPRGPGASYNTYQIIGQRHVRDGDGRRDRRRGRTSENCPTNPVMITTATVANP